MLHILFTVSGQEAGSELLSAEGEERRNRTIGAIVRRFHLVRLHCKQPVPSSSCQLHAFKIGKSDVRLSAHF